MADDDRCYSTLLIDGSGNFNVTGINKFLERVDLVKCGESYAVVSIIGPLGSGKSTLLNYLFRTNFREMDGFARGSQTTKGIWIAKCVGIVPRTLVMDLEGTDGRGRGLDDTAFETQSAIFALAVSDIVLINMWYHDIGREHAAHKPLLKTVFQAMMLLFSPRKTTLMFVVRHKTQTTFEKSEKWEPQLPQDTQKIWYSDRNAQGHENLPLSDFFGDNLIALSSFKEKQNGFETETNLERMESFLRGDIQKIWDSVPKPHAHKETPLSEFFNVKVVALPCYEVDEELFEEEVSNLRKRFFYSIASGGLAGDRRGVVPASDFASSAKQIWKVIKDNKELDLDLQAYKEWHHLDNASLFGSVLDFRRKLHSILGNCFIDPRYDEESLRTESRKYLEDKILQLAEPAFQSTLGDLRSEALEKFKEAFKKSLDVGEGFSDAAYKCTNSILHVFSKGCTGISSFGTDSLIEQANWDTSEVKSNLVRDLDEHITSIRASKLDELTSRYEAKLNKAICGPVKALLDNANDETWSSIRKLLKHETQSAVFELASDLPEFKLEEKTRDEMSAKLENYARGLAEAKAKEAAGMVRICMKDRFITSFKPDNGSLVWTEKNDIVAVKKFAESEALKLVSILSAIRLDDESDDIYTTLTDALSENSSCDRSSTLMASNTWDKVPLSKTLISPVQCKSLWEQFQVDIEYTVNQATVTQVLTGSHTYKWKVWISQALSKAALSTGLALIPLSQHLGYRQ